MTEPTPCTASGLHEAVASELKSLAPPPAKILDIAAGKGAFTSRLLEMGYSAVANDINPSQWALPAVNLMTVDLNTSFSGHFASTHFDIIVAIEVIEHLESPLSFLRECFKALPHRGRLLLTTPNVTSALSRAMFLRTGKLSYFDEGWYGSSGHISILPQWLLVKHAVTVGFGVEKMTYVVPSPVLSIFQKIATAVAGKIGRYPHPEERDGVCILLILNRP
jgi:SAM-dependent methyltransferase